MVPCSAASIAERIREFAEAVLVVLMTFDTDDVVERRN
jgi:hypothetical protein